MNPEIPEDVLNEPAFNVSAPDHSKINDSDVPELVREDSDPEIKVEPRKGRKEEDTEVTPRFQDRFNEIYGEAKRHEREASEARDRADRLERLLEQSMQQGRTPEKRGVPEEWKKVLGETEATEAFYELLDRELSTREQRAVEKAYERYVEEQQGSTEAIRANEGVIDSELESLENSIGRELTDDEASAILDIADELTPQENGKYTTNLVPLRAAYGEYRARQFEAKAPQQQQRQRVASVVSAKGSGLGESPATREVRGRPNPDGWRKAIGL
jgi:hypothetical protein